MRLEGSIEKLRGSLRFESHLESFHETGALLSFHDQTGVSLEWSGAEARHDHLEFVEGDFAFRIFVPSLQVVRSQMDGGGSHFTAEGAELFTSYDNPDPRGRQFSQIRINIPFLHQYLNIQVPSWQQGSNYDLSYAWKNSLLTLGTAFPEQASIWLEVSAYAANDLVHGVSLEPRPQIGIDFTTPLTFDKARIYAASLRNLFEILSTRPTGKLTTRFYQDQSCVVLRESLNKRSLGTMTTTPLALKYSLCEPHMSMIIPPWLKSIGQSPAVDNLLRLLQYPDLPFDLRFFMAFSALGYLNTERSNGGNHRAKVPEIQHLKAFTPWWKMLVPRASDADLEKYLERVANTRHDIAHLSRPKHQILSERTDLLRGFNQLHVLARACLFESMGLPRTECDSYVRSLSTYIIRHFGEVPKKLLC